MSDRVWIWIAVANPIVTCIIAIVLAQAMRRRWQQEAVLHAEGARWRRITLGVLETLSTRSKLMARSLDQIIAQVSTLRASVTHNQSLESSLIAVNRGLADQVTQLRQQLAEAGTNEEKLAELGDAMDALASTVDDQAAALAKAAIANTDAAPHAVAQPATPAPAPTQDAQPAAPSTPPVEPAVPAPAAETAPSAPPAPAAAPSAADGVPASTGPAGQPGDPNVTTPAS